MFFATGDLPDDLEEDEAVANNMQYDVEAKEEQYNNFQEHKELESEITLLKGGVNCRGFFPISTLWTLVYDVLDEESDNHEYAIDYNEYNLTDIVTFWTEHSCKL